MRKNCYLFLRNMNKRSSNHRTSNKGVLKNFAKFTGKHLCQSLFFNKVSGLRPGTLFKKILWHRCFPVNFAKFLRTSFLQNTCGRLLLKIVKVRHQIIFYLRVLFVTSCILINILIPRWVFLLNYNPLFI